MFSRYVIVGTEVKSNSRENVSKTYESVLDLVTDVLLGKVTNVRKVLDRESSNKIDSHLGLSAKPFLRSIHITEDNVIKFQSHIPVKMGGENSRDFTIRNVLKHSLYEFYEGKTSKSERALRELLIHIDSVRHIAGVCSATAMRDSMVALLEDRKEEMEHLGIDHRKIVDIAGSSYFIESYVSRVN